MPYSTSYRIFTVLNITFMVIISLLCIVPFIHILAISLSSKAAATANIVQFWPVEFTWDSYVLSFENPFFVKSFWNSLNRTVLGTAISMVLCATAAYPLSKENRVFPGRTIYSWFFIFTMLFSAGLIPHYLLVVNLGLRNTIWALVLPGAVNVFNMVLMLNFFRRIPKELEEAAFIDGAGYFRALVLIYLPLSLPSIATLSLFSLVGQWNAWFDGLIYLNDMSDYPLATLLQQMTAGANVGSTDTYVDPETLSNVSDRTLRTAQIFMSIIPILIVYPLLQRYFVQGMTLGSVKE
ncbi:carbohydrate ABC transporter permease [Paenibacillus chungangensis]|uniref:Carbohydrate ABC transporter permease n=1 Tax=Paenibacillus chungangensis TaxID=696535 RepID=A0ABW3HW30_9BACL